MLIYSGDGIETNNVEIAALEAPIPMIVVFGGKDWTKKAGDKSMLISFGIICMLEVMERFLLTDQYSLNKKYL